MATNPRVFTIPPSAQFLPTLARAILDGDLIPGFAPRRAPELLADTTIYLPTRRAARALSLVLLDEMKSPALLLPRIVPLGDVDEEAFAFEADALEPLAPAISAGERRLALAKLIAKYAEQTGLLPASPMIAIALADELAHLIDDFLTAGLEFSAIQKAAEGEFGNYDEYWKRSRDFLAIVDQGWRAFLQERGSIDSAARRDALLTKEAERLARSKSGPVIAAGSTGTLPKVAELLSVIARRENGAVVLPGLDQSLDKKAFALIGSEEEPMPGHPQFGLKRLIEKIGIVREAIEPIGVPAHSLRENILSLAFRPQDDDEDASRKLAAENSLAGVSIIEAADAREEGLAIALALREALEQQKTAVLVTPDRALARRVCAELTRWNIDIDDSAGLPLADSEAGRLARLTAKAAEEDAAPSTILALLRHPYLRTHFPAEEIALFEIACLRGTRPAGGVAGLPVAIAAKRQDKFHGSDARHGFDAGAWDRAAKVAIDIASLLAPLTALAGSENAFSAFATGHRDVLATILAENDSDDCQKLSEALDTLCGVGDDAPAMTLGDYTGSFPSAIREFTLRPARSENERLRILGPLEARMISADRIVLGGLCEGIWPPEAHTDSWLNRPMRRELGLDLPERRIGLSAHDFVQAASAKELFFSHSKKQGGVETIASRFLQRLDAVAADKDWREAKKRGQNYIDWARSLEHAERGDPLAPPRPMPPLSARPRRFSMSDMRDLTRDPYSIYARKILTLRKLDAVDEDPGHADRGTLLHEILAKFTAKNPGKLTESALDDLVAIGEEAFAPMQGYPAVFAVWWPRFKRAAKWFVEQERERRDKIASIHSEVDGSIEIGAGNERFTLTARADRIEVNKDKSVAVLDFKTGTLPSYKEAILGFEPQLLLEAAIAREGGFKGIPEAKKLSEVGPVKISGGHPPGSFELFELSAHKDFKAVAEPRGIAGDNHLDLAAEQALKGATRLLAKYAQSETAYPFAPRVQWQKDYNDYEHLARFKEWSEGE